MVFIMSLNEYSDLKFCNRCGILLIVGDNWCKSHKKFYNYTCKGCENIRVKNRNYITGRSKPMYENKKCSSYLGIYISEQVLSKVFNNVEVMPPTNPSYDFICNKGKKIDVKSSCIRIDNINNVKYFKWNFKIRKNKVADYFLCIAFDNREDLNPLHVWLIPGNEVNRKQTASISPSTTHKWDKYRINTDKVTEWCNKLKEENK